MSLLALCASLAIAARAFHWRVGGMLRSLWLLTAMLAVLVAVR